MSKQTNQQNEVQTANMIPEDQAKGEALVQFYQDFCTKKQSYTPWLTAIGLGGETGEVLDIIKKAYRDSKDVNLDHLAEELGDVLWYVANLCTHYNLKLEDVIKQNIKKLSARYSI